MKTEERMMTMMKIMTAMQERLKTAANVWVVVIRVAHQAQGLSTSSR